MIQYASAETIVIRNIDNEILKVTNFRKRIKYDPKQLFTTTLLDTEVLRTDILSNRLIGNIFNVGQIIDANEVDVFSMDEGDTINYYKLGYGY